jgi:DNA replication and repair protein RecF
MRLSSLKITSFRNLSSLFIEPTSAFNLIHGPNGSGKTSILEAIYLLGMARSFRSHLLNRTIQYEAPSFSVVGDVCDKEESSLRIGVEKYRNNKIKIKISSNENGSAVALARVLPVKLINPDSYSLLNSGPRHRRQFLDWGLFHVEPQFFSVWQRFQRILKQRNSALQQGVKVDLIKAWNAEFVLKAYELARLRKEYVQQLCEKISLMISDIFNITHFDLGYYPGWDTQRDLLEVLEASYFRDTFLGYTQFGPQRADLALKINTLPVQAQLSRGEQKMLVYILQLAQGALFKDLTSKSCVYLVDDLAAELDNNRRRVLLDALQQQAAQVFITTTEVEQLDFLENRGIVNKISLCGGNYFKN